MRSSTWRLEDLRNVTLNLGFVGENLHTRQIFDCKKMFDQYPNASVSMTVTPPEGEPYPGQIERDGDLVIWDVRDCDLVKDGDGEIQIVFTQEPHIARSYNAKTHICRSQQSTGSIPSGYEDFIVHADQLLDQVEDTFPAGGTTGQVLAKKSNADYDTEWVNQGAGGTSDYDELENRPQIGGVTLTGNKSLHDLGAASEEAVSAKYTKPETGIPAEDMASGVIPVLTDLIDDTAGDGDTNKVWSADKSSALLTEINSKYEKPTGGIPSSDMTDAVQTSLGKADSSYQKPSSGIPGTDLADSYIKEPSSDGTNGQVLTTDGNGGRSWTTVQGGGGGVSDVKVNGTSVVSQGEANVPLAGSSNVGVVKVSGGGLQVDQNGQIRTDKASENGIKDGTNWYAPIVPYNQHTAAFYGMAKAAGDTSQASSANAVGTYTEDAQSKISDMLHAPVPVSGSTPSITAKSGVRYICGECATLSITAPASGCIDVVFESGSTATVLTVTSAKTGVSAIKWTNGFDPTNLEANTTYEINILDGEFGVVGSWT